MITNWEHSHCWSNTMASQGLSCLFMSPNGTTMEGWFAEDLGPYDTNKRHPPLNNPFSQHWHFITTTYNEYKLDERLTLPLKEDKFRADWKEWNCGLTDIHKALEEEQEWDKVSTCRRKVYASKLLKVLKNRYEDWQLTKNSSGGRQTLKQSKLITAT